MQGSSLEFQLHQLQFMHVLRIKGRSEALEYAKLSFTAFATQHMADIQRLMACLLWANRLESSPYKDLLSPSHWDVVALQFSRECCNLLGQAYESPLYVTLSAGAQALTPLLKLATVMSSKKQVRSQLLVWHGMAWHITFYVLESVLGSSSSSFRSELMKWLFECMQEWAALKQMPVEIELDKAYQFHSVFACPVSREQSTEHNPPMLMRCGHVLCKQSIQKLTKSNSRTFKCPYCPSETTASQCRQIYFWCWNAAAVLGIVLSCSRFRWERHFDRLGARLPVVKIAVQRFIWFNCKLASCMYSSVDAQCVHWVRRALIHLMSQSWELHQNCFAISFIESLKMAVVGHQSALKNLFRPQLVIKYHFQNYVRQSPCEFQMVSDFG